MKRVLIGVLSLSLLVGCSAIGIKRPSASEETQNPDGPAKGETAAKPEVSEELFIKQVEESCQGYQASAEKLKELLANINVKDQDWQAQIDVALLEVHWANEKFMKTEVALSKETRKKYVETTRLYNKGRAAFKIIDRNFQQALQTYDTEALAAMPATIDAAIVPIQEALEQLENDQNKK